MLHVKPETITALTRKEKLLRWAELVRRDPTHSLELFSQLEYIRPNVYHQIPIIGNVPYTAMSVAASDPVFQSLGIGGNLRSLMDFFELSIDEAHYFSCDCGGYISAECQAQRIERLANDEQW